MRSMKIYEAKFDANNVVNQKLTVDADPRR